MRHALGLWPSNCDSPGDSPVAAEQDPSLRTSVKAAMKLAGGQSFVIVAVVCCLGGCSNHATDSESRTFTESCDGPKCVWRTDSGGEYRIDSRGRVLALCPIRSTGIYECRSIRCTGDRDCSVATSSGYSCSEGTCVAEGKTYASSDKIIMCQSGTGAYQGTALQRSRITLARACDVGCVLPDECRLENLERQSP